MLTKIRKRLAEDRIKFHAVALVQAINEAGHKIHDPEDRCGLVCVFCFPPRDGRKAELNVQQTGKFEYIFPIDFEVL